jgi:hypothetical protein
MLKRTVEVRRKADATTVQYGLWEVEIPNSWLDANACFGRLLAREVDAASWMPGSDEEDSLFRLLTTQGCLEAAEKATYQGSEILTLFESAVSSWYAAYYSDPIWTRLAEGCSRNHLLAWLIQNYHISRSAGITDARCATFLPRPELRHEFRRTGLEEYWHCDAFYFVKHPYFGTDEHDIKRYIALPSTAAFDQQMLALAESDALAYVMVSYFQESSVRFGEDSKRFYRILESRYGLGEFFRPWEKHLNFDFEYQHGEHYAEMFRHFDETPIAQLRRSVSNAALTVSFLQLSFEEILDQPDSDTLLLRNPLQFPADTALTAVLGLARSEILGLCDEHRDAVGLLSRIIDAFVAHVGHDTSDRRLVPATVSGEAWAELERTVGDVAFRGMAFSYDHDEIQALGALAETLEPAQEPVGASPSQRASEWTAVRNCLREAAHKPRELLQLIFCLDRVTRTTLGRELLRAQGEKRMRRWMDRAEIRLSDLSAVCVFLEHWLNVRRRLDLFVNFDLLTS